MGGVGVLGAFVWVGGCWFAVLPGAGVCLFGAGSKSGSAHEGGFENDLPSASQHQITLVL
ncbi:hypothetical protein HAL013_00230 [Helicobacter ailurogastricus]|uniref:Uncharacterized protein n=1 Tax=Helicobacter ailurogastricus TaxID=1578720 RepID=A0A0K2X8J9_9HELI|nr:hypothetical protein HAL013_00230 [Helicobacter ailurogastricus]